MSSEMNCEKAMIHEAHDGCVGIVDQTPALDAATLTIRMKSAILTAHKNDGKTVCDGRTGAALIRRGLATCRPGLPGRQSFPVLNDRGLALLAYLRR